MKRFGHLFIASFILCLTILVGCNKDVDVKVYTGKTTEVTCSTVVLNGEVAGNDKNASLVCGFHYGINSDMSDAMSVSTSTSNGAFSVLVTGLSANTKYYYQAYVNKGDDFFRGEIKSFVTNTEETGSGSGSGEVSGTGNLNGHSYVDLGLPSGLKWATCNVGATKPEEPGSYYAWGETSTKTEYTWETYTLCNGSMQTLTKYNTNENYGVVDNKSVLESCDDVATVNWGNGWRMPTKDELHELATECNWASATLNNKSGWQVTGPNGNSIFLPLGGDIEGSEILGTNIWGIYYTSTMEMNVPYYAWYLYLTFSQCLISDSNRCYGYTVRAVCQ